MAVGSERKYHVGLAAGEVGAYVLMPGDPGRTALIAAHLEGAREVAFNREYRTFTGRLERTPVSTTSSGIGGPSVAIAVEELSDLGVHTFLRVGTCGALQPGIRRGDLVVARGAVRDEGTPAGYVPLQYPAIADHEVVAACLEAARQEGAPCHAGIVRSVDALYADLSPERLPRGEEIAREHRVWRQAGVVAQDMESSTLMVVASLKGLRAGTILLCVDEVGEGEIEHLEPSLMDRMLKVAAGAIRRLIEQDRAAQGQ
ncbi:MAG: nucleoside phosphorylase [Candidatus Dormibacterales bacterium]